MDRWRSGLGLIEAVVAIAVLAVVVPSVVGLLVQSSKGAVGGEQRIILELRARRHAAEIVTTPYSVALSTEAKDYPLTIDDPAKSDGYREFVDGIVKERTVVEGVGDRIARLRTEIVWKDRATGGHEQKIETFRLFTNPAIAISDRRRLTRVDPVGSP